MVSQQLQVRTVVLRPEMPFTPKKPLLLQAGDLKPVGRSEDHVQSKELGVATSSRELREHGGG